MKRKQHQTGAGLLHRILPIVLMTALAISLFITGTTAISKDYETATNLALAGKATNIKVDGVLDEEYWASATWYGVAERQVATTMNNTIDFAAAWDDKNFYVGIKVIDATVVKENLNENIYCNDGIEIFIDPNNAKVPGKYDADTLHLMYQVADGDFAIWGTTDKWTDITAKYPNTTAKHIITDDGYTVEVSIPFSEMGIDRLVDGTVFGLEVNNNDDDNPDSNSDEDRLIQFWNKETDAGSAATWGNVSLYNDAKSLISYAGTPTIDGIINENEGWIFTAEKLDEAAGINFRMASMCDDKSFYIAIDLWGTDLELAGMNMLFDFDNSKDPDGESPKHINHWSFKDNAGKYNQTNGIIKTNATDDGYTIEIQAPLDVLGEKPSFLDSVGVQVEMFQVKEDYSNRIFWSDADTSKLWSSSLGYGSLIFNNINVAGGNNTIPTGNQIASYSIPVDTKLSGKITVTDEDGDALTYKFDPANKQASDSMGKFELNETTGEWSFTPGKMAKAGTIANYYVQVTDDEGATFHQRVEIRIEYAPTNKTYYVDGDNGKDFNDGLSEETPFKSIYTAISKVRPGDTVIIHESEVPYGYDEQREHFVSASGLPDAYITFKAAEGEQPVINCRNVWNYFKIAGSYIIVDGLTVRGQGFEIMEEFDKTYESYRNAVNGGSVGSAGRYNSNGICFTPDSNSDRIGSLGIDTYKVIHHIEVRNCVVDNVAGGGIVGLGCDYITIENNTVINCCWGDMYGSSGISLLQGIDVDDNFDAYKYIIRNNIAAGNRHFVPWVSVKKFSDGNGIIVDSTDNTGINKSLLAKGDKWGVLPFGGKTLVANNLVYLNGGSGIHIFNGDNCDMISNTVFSNNMNPALGWSDFFSNAADHINMINNIVYAHKGSPLNISSTSSSDVFYDNNLFYNYSSNNLGQAIKGPNGAKGTTVGENNLYATDPLFVNVYEKSYDKSKAYPSEWSQETKNTAKNGGYYIGENYDVTTYGYDFNLKESSPALGAGNKEWSDMLGNTDNRIGIFGTIGSPLMSVKLSDAVPNTDIDRGETPTTEAYESSTEPEQDETKPVDTTDSKKDSDTVKADDTEPTVGGDDTESSFPIAIPIVIVAIVIAIVVAVLLAKKKTTTK